MPTQLPSAVRVYIGKFVLRSRTVGFVTSVGLALAIGLAWAVLACLVDRFVRLPRLARIVVMALDILVVGILVSKAALKLVRRVDWLDATRKIERKTDAFGERLQTLGSQLLGPARYRGSSQMLAALTRDVESRTAKGLTAGLVSWQGAARIWGVLILLVLTLRILWPNEWLGLPRLAERLLHPLRKIAPVAMCQIDIEPRDRDVSPGESVDIVVTASRIEGRAPVLYLSNDGANWSHVGMTPSLGSSAPVSTRPTTPAQSIDGLYIFSLPSIERDLQYYVEAGDAKSETYQLRAKRVPAVSEFRIRYTLPGYTRHAPISVANLDGRIEMLRDSSAEVTIVSTEPIGSANIVLDDGSRLNTFPGARPNERIAWVDLRHDATYHVEMVSLAGVSESTAAGAVIHPLNDRPPVVRILQPRDDVRLESDDIVVLRYEAVDDYAVASLEAMVRINTRVAAVFPVPLTTSLARQEGEFPFILGDLDPHNGDVVTFSFRAGDAKGQMTTSELLRVLIAPVSAGVKSIGRAAELKHALGLANAWQADVQKAKALFDAASSGDRRAPKPDSWLKASRALGDAAEASSVLRQTLLRAIARSESPMLSATLITLVDDTVIQLTEPGRTLTASARSDENIAPRLRAAVGRAQSVVARLKVLSEGEGAQLALAEHTDLKAVEAAPPVDPTAMGLRTRAIEHARRSRDLLLRDLGLNPGATDVEAGLTLFIGRERELVSPQSSVDLSRLAEEWARQVSRPVIYAGTSEFAARLFAAADAEIVRPDADIVRARNLQLAARAATAIPLMLAQQRDDRTRGTKPPDGREMTQAFLSAFAVLNRRHEPTRNIDPAKSATAEALAAVEARARLAVLAGQVSISTAVPSTVSALSEAWPRDDLAFAAAAEMASRHYLLATEYDARLADELAMASAEDSSRFMDEMKLRSAAASRIDELAARQERLSQQSAALNSHSDQWAAVLQQEQDLADELASVARSGDLPGAAAANENHEPVFTAPSARAASRNPAAAAAWYARLGADALARTPGDISYAVGAQHACVRHLRLAWQRIVTRAAIRRLETIPAFAAIYEPSVAETSDSQGLVAFGSWIRGSRARDWLGPLEFRPTTRDSSPKSDVENAAYSDQLRAYFEAVSRAKDDRGQR